MQWNDDVRAFITTGDWLGLSQYLWERLGSVEHGHEAALAAAVAFVLLLIVLFWIGGHAPAETRLVLPREKVLPSIQTKGTRPRGTVYIPLELGKVLIDLQPHKDQTVHVVIGGTSRLGKSTTVLPLLDLPIGVLIVALDNTRPIAERIRELPDGVEWTNEPNWPVGLDLLTGDARIVSEVLVEGWTAKSTGDTGKWRTIAGDRIWSALEELDAQRIRRNIPDIARALWIKTGDSEIDRACRDWAGRLLRLQRAMGDSLGTDLDLVQAMRRGRKVLLRVNPYLNPKDAPMLGGMLLVHARRTAQEAGVPFVLIIEEAGQLGDYQDEITPLAQAGADRGVPLVLLTQNMSLMPVGVANNMSVTVSFAQEDAKEMRFAAHRLRLEPEHLRRENFPGKGEQQGRGWAFVRAPGVSTTLVQIRLPKRVRRGGPSVVSATRGEGGIPPTWDVVVGPPIAEVDGWRPWTPMLPEPETRPSWVGTDKDMLRMWNQCARTGRRSVLWSPSRGLWFDERGCLEWQGTMTTVKRGSTPRPRSTLNRHDITVYIEFFRRARGNPEPTLDHCCDNPACCDPDHLEACGVAENTRRNTPRRLAFELAGWTQGELTNTESGEVTTRWVQRVAA